MPSVEMRCDDREIAWVRFDDPGRPVNVLDRPTMEALRNILADLRFRAGLKGVVLASGKPDCFLAGADLELIGSIRSPEEGKALAEEAQTTAQALAGLAVPTVALIRGACLGGGLEIALACDWRVAADLPKTSLGLPETQLGLLPAMGGTQRLPRLVGLPNSMQTILAGRTHTARQAEKIGLVDEAPPPEILESRAGVWLARGKRPGGIDRARWLTATPLRGLVLAAGRREILKRTGGRYPAPLRAIEVMRKGIPETVEDGMKLEAQAFGELAASPVAKRLIELFFLREKQGKPPQGSARDVRRVGICGAGVMGGGIAQLVSIKGLPVRLRDIAPEAVSRALSTASDLNRGLVRSGRLSRIEARDVLNRISPTLDLSGFDKADWVIEAVVEKLEVKKKVLAELETKVPERAVLATNTSSLPIHKIAEGLKHPGRVVGFHFFNPVHKMPLIEVIPAAGTDPEVVRSAVKFAQRLGKTPVVVKDAPGFLVNRVLAPYLAEAARCLAEGAGVEEIDGAIRRFGMPVGPLELLDQVGLDVAGHAARTLEEAFGERMRMPPELEPLAERGWLGKKSGTGFYEYRGKRKSPNPHFLDWRKQNAPLGDMEDRMILMLVNEAILALQEEVVPAPGILDLAMVLGTGFAPFRGGPLRHADDLGLPRIASRLEQLRDRYGPRFEPAPLLRERAAAPGRFYP